MSLRGLRMMMMLAHLKQTRRLDSWRRRGPIPASLEAEALREPWAELNRHIEPFEV
jgi:hypothetical protein